MIIINEKTTGSIPLTFSALVNGVVTAVTPDTLQCSIIDAASGTVVRALAAVSPAPSASTYDLAITAAENSIQNVAHLQEIRIVTVIFTYSGGQATGEYRYAVRNLGGVI